MREYILLKIEQKFHYCLKMNLNYEKKMKKKLDHLESYELIIGMNLFSQQNYSLNSF